MEPLSVISLFFNLASFNANNKISQIEDNQYYYSIADAKHQIFSNEIENLNVISVNKFSNFNLSLKK